MMTLQQKYNFLNTWHDKLQKDLLHISSHLQENFIDSVLIDDDMTTADIETIVREHIALDREFDHKENQMHVIDILMHDIKEKLDDIKGGRDVGREYYD